MSDRIVIDVDRDGWTNRLQLNIAQLDETGRGNGYRLAGPKYNGSSKRLLRCEVDERDASEIRGFLDAAFPAAAKSQEPDAAAPQRLAEFGGAEALVAALEASPEVRPGTAGQLAADLIADVLRSAAAVQRGALDRGVPAEAPSVGRYLVDLIDPDVVKDTRGALPLLPGESTRARKSAQRLAEFLGGARTGRSGGSR